MKRSFPSPYADAAEKPRSSASFRFHKKHGHMMPEGIKVGKKHAVKMTGKITGVRSDEYGHSLDMDMDTMSHDSDMDKETEDQPRSLTKAMRNRHLGSGRFTG